MRIFNHKLRSNESSAGLTKTIKHLGDETLGHLDWFWQLQPQDDVFLLFAILLESQSPKKKGWWHRGEDANAVS